MSDSHDKPGSQKEKNSELDRDRTASMADEGGYSGAAVEGEKTPEPETEPQQRLKLVQFKTERAPGREFERFLEENESTLKRVGVALAIAAGATVMGLAIALTQGRKRKSWK